MADKKKVQKEKYTGDYKIITTDGNVLYRNASNLEGAKMARLKAKGWKVEKV